MTPPVDLLRRTAELVDIASVSRNEAEITAWLTAALRDVPGLELTRVGDNLVARTSLGRGQRLILAGHTDTVPVNGNATAVIEGDRLYGVGSTDMKGGLAVMVEAARTFVEPAVDVTYVFFAREEIASAESGLAELYDQRPDLLVGDAALLGEPTDGVLEAGCQGTLRLRVELRGERAHTARPWMGRNAIHRLGGLLAALADQPERRPVLLGCEYREALQAVGVSGGVAANVVPDHAEVVLNHRFAPDRTGEQAEAHVRSVLAPWLEPDDTVELVDLAPAAAPALDHPLVAALVARFAEHGVPAANFGPGDATIAHTAGEHLDRAPLERVWTATADLLTRGA